MRLSWTLALPLSRTLMLRLGKNKSVNSVVSRPPKPLKSFSVIPVWFVLPLSYLLFLTPYGVKPLDFISPQSSVLSFQLKPLRTLKPLDSRQIHAGMTGGGGACGNDGEDRRAYASSPVAPECLCTVAQALRRIWEHSVVGFVMLFVMVLVMLLVMPL